MRLRHLGLGLCLAVGGVGLALGSGINVTPPPPSASNVSGLGTAATVNTGTSAGNVPVLDGSGKLSAAVVPAGGVAATADALTSNPADCGASQFAYAIAATGDLTCSSIGFASLQGSAIDSQIPDSITVNLAATATALAANPTACSAGQYVTDADANGGLTCAAVAIADVTNAGDLASGDDATDVPYTPADGSDWVNPDPADAAEGLDDIAARVTDVETAASGYQPIDATLTALGGASCVADRVLYCSGNDTVTSGTLTAAGRALIDDADASAQRTTLELGSIATAATSAYAATANNLSDLANASTARTNLGLGTAATLSVGTGASQIVQRDGSGNYPSGNGSALTSVAAATSTALAANGANCSAGSAPLGVDASGAAESCFAVQASDSELSALAGLASAANTVPSFTGIGTAALLTVGTAASNLVQLDGSAHLPAVDGSALTGIAQSQVGTADAWNVSWTSASGNPGTSGNYTGSPTASIIGAGAFDGSAASFGGVSAWKFTPTGASARQGLQLVLSQTMNTSMEFRVRVYGPASPFCVGLSTADATDAQFLVSPATTALTYIPGTNTAIGSTGDVTNRWVTITIRLISSDATAASEAPYLLQVWAGEVMVGVVQGVQMTNGVSVDNAIRIERNSGTSTTPFYIASIQWRSGLNARLPSQTFAGNGFDQ